MPSNQSRMKAKTLFITDIAVLLTFLPASISGFALHAAGHNDINEIWHNWAVTHIFSTLAFTISVGVHIYSHWNWYKTLFQKGLGNKSKVTLLLSILMIATVTTGLIVLFIHQDPNSGHGLWHYVIGIILTVIGLGHFFKRVHVLVKGLNKVNK